jgi:hypothetical protein
MCTRSTIVPVAEGLGLTPPITNDEVAETLARTYQGPEGIREGFDLLEIEPLALVPAFSTRYNLERVGLGSGEYIPLDPRSRRSIYEIDDGETVLTGVLTGDDGLHYQFLTRVESVGGSPGEPGNGDIYELSILGSACETVIVAQGSFEIQNPEIGLSHINFNNVSQPGGELVDITWRCTSIGWSFKSECEVTLDW